MTERHTLSEAYRALRQKEAETQAKTHLALVRAIGNPKLLAKVEKINERRTGHA